MVTVERKVKHMMETFEVRAYNQTTGRVDKREWTNVEYAIRCALQYDPTLDAVQLRIQLGIKPAVEVL